MGSDWVPRPPGTATTARRCGDGLVHWVHYYKLKGDREPGQWLRICDANDDCVTVQTLPLAATDVTCVACVALESRGAHVRAS